MFSNSHRLWTGAKHKGRFPGISLGCLNLELHSCSQTLGLDTVCSEIIDREVINCELINSLLTQCSWRLRNSGRQALEQGQCWKIQDRHKALHSKQLRGALAGSQWHRASSHSALPSSAAPTAQAPLRSLPAALTLQRSQGSHKVQAVDFCADLGNFYSSCRGIKPPALGWSP